jgi:hypothetical protein
MSGNLAKIRSIKISETNFLDIDSDGTYSKKLENGHTITLTIDKGKIVKTAAQDDKGNPAKTFYLKMHSEDEGQVCYCCSGGDGTYRGGGPNWCGPIPCRLA